MKYCRPIYAAINRIDSSLARATFIKSRSFYHPIAARLIAKVCPRVGLIGADGCRISDWSSTVSAFGSLEVLQSGSYCAYRRRKAARSLARWGVILARDSQRFLIRSLGEGSEFVAKSTGEKWTAQCTQGAYGADPGAGRPVERVPGRNLRTPGAIFQLDLDSHLYRLPAPAPSSVPSCMCVELIARSKADCRRKSVYAGEQVRLDYLSDHLQIVSIA